MHLINYIIWTTNPEIFPSLDIIQPRWYGLLFALGFIIGQQIVFYIFKKENKPQKDVDSLTLYMIIATVIGARLGHVLFYEPGDYFSNPIDILKIWEGGLASHGAAFGILFGLFLYSNYLINLNPLNFKWKKQKRKGQDFFWVVDRIVILVALGGCFIRFGNFMNSEIIGKPTQSNMGVVFARDVIDILEQFPQVDEVNVAKDEVTKYDSLGQVPIGIKIKFDRATDRSIIESQLNDEIKRVLFQNPYITKHIQQPVSYYYDITISEDNHPEAIVQSRGIPRHPAQLYESFTCLLIFLLLLGIWIKLKSKTPRGLLLGLFLILIFGLRFVHEFFKENQVAFENNIPLNMGQWLSIPLVLAGVLLLLNLKKINARYETQ